MLSEIKRTLVKSPPELWAELSDPVALARHLGEFGEIRITRADPEARVEWEADQASGTVELAPSGWGTKVTLSISREVGAPTPTPDNAMPVAEELAVKPAPAMEEETEPLPATSEQTEPEPTLGASSEPETPIEAAVSETVPQTQAPTPTSVTEPAPQQATQAEAPISSEPPARRGFFARLFKRRRDQDIPDSTENPEPPSAILQTEPLPEESEQTESSAVPVAQEEDPRQTPPATLEGEEQTTSQSEASAECSEPEPPLADPETATDISAELAQAEQLMAEQTTAMLSAMLDRLGAAHHRPFSRG